MKTSGSFKTPEGSILISDSYDSAKAEAMSEKIVFRWITFEVISHSIAATIVCGGIYVADEYYGADTPTATIVPHQITGFVLGLLLLCRVVMGSVRAYTAGSLLTTFCKHCRTISLFSTYVTETLTVSAGAELEQKAVAAFRYDLVRLLNLAWLYYKAMLTDTKLQKPPAALVPKGSLVEAQVLSSVKNPTVIVAKLITNLLEKQFTAQRLRAEQVSLFSSEIADMITTYHASQSLSIAPPSVALEGFTKVFVVIWVYTLCPIIAITELRANPAGDNTAGFVLSLFYTFLIALFYFGLFEAGKLVAKPFKAALAVVDLTELTSTLSDDLANLVDDGEVPVFLPPK